MTASAIEARPQFPVVLIVARSRGLLIAILVFAILFAVLNIVSPEPLQLFRLQLSIRWRSDIGPRGHGTNVGGSKRWVRSQCWSCHIAGQRCVGIMDAGYARFPNRVRYSRNSDRRCRWCIQWLFHCLPPNAVDRRHLGNNVHCSGCHAADHGDARGANSSRL